jgi:hypothetical protein
MSFFEGVISKERGEGEEKKREAGRKQFGSRNFV